MHIEASATMTRAHCFTQVATIANTSDSVELLPMVENQTRSLVPWTLSRYMCDTCSCPPFPQRLAIASRLSLLTSISSYRSCWIILSHSSKTLYLFTLQLNALSRFEWTILSCESTSSLIKKNPDAANMRGPIDGASEVVQCKKRLRRMAEHVNEFHRYNQRIKFFFFFYVLSAIYGCAADLDILLDLFSLLVPVLHPLDSHSLISSTR